MKITLGVLLDIAYMHMGAQLMPRAEQVLEPCEKLKNMIKSWRHSNCLGQLHCRDRLGLADASKRHQFPAPRQGYSPLHL